MKNLKMKIAMATLVATGSIRNFKVQLDNGTNLEVQELTYTGNAKDILDTLKALKEGIKEGIDFNMSGNNESKLTIKGLKIGQGASQMVLEHLEFNSAYEALNFALQFKEMDLSEP